MAGILASHGMLDGGQLVDVQQQPRQVADEENLEIRCFMTASGLAGSSIA